MQADINGPQRKILSARTRPLKPTHGLDGIAVREGRCLPFVVERQWSAPAGYYVEQWFLVKPETGEVFIEGPAKESLILGLQARTDLTDEVTEALPLEPGAYRLVFALGGLKGGEVDVQVVEAPAEEAA